MTFREQERALYRTYGPRNDLYLELTSDRVTHLCSAIGDLNKALRKGITDERLRIALARIGARVFGVTQRFRSIPLVETFTRKYLTEVCAYCQQAPCQCAIERRPSCQLAKQAIHLDWTMAQCQSHLESHYGHINRKEGLHWVLGRLYEEAGEVADLQKERATWDGTYQEFKDEMAGECADAYAWTFAPASLLGIDLGLALKERYGPSCWRCHKRECECGPFRHRKMDWDKVPNDIRGGMAR